MPEKHRRLMEVLRALKDATVSKEGTPESIAAVMDLWNIAEELVYRTTHN